MFQFSDQDLGEAATFGSAAAGGAPDQKETGAAAALQAARIWSRSMPHREQEIGPPAAGYASPAPRR